jgi:hypothetical protein
LTSGARAIAALSSAPDSDEKRTGAAMVATFISLVHQFLTAEKP